MSGTNDAEVRLLIPFLETAISIECIPCGDESITGGSEWLAAQTFYQDGWRVVDDEAVCPQCYGERETGNCNE